MNRTRTGYLVSVSIATCLLAYCGTTAADEPAVVWQLTREFSAPEAHQAVAADERFVYAVTNRLVAKYDRIGRTSGR